MKTQLITYKGKDISAFTYGGTTFYQSDKVAEVLGEQVAFTAEYVTALDIMIHALACLKANRVKAYEAAEELAFELHTEEDITCFNQSNTISILFLYENAPFFKDAFDSAHKWEAHLIHAQLEFEAAKKQAQRGCKVYFMRDSRNGMIKIGVSRNPLERESTLQSECPSITLIQSFAMPSKREAYDLESTLHRIYQDQRVRGEWFNLSSYQLQEAFNTANTVMESRKSQYNPLAA